MGKITWCLWYDLICFDFLKVYINLIFEIITFFLEGLKLAIFEELPELKSGGGKRPHIRSSILFEIFKTYTYYALKMKNGVKYRS